MYVIGCIGPNRGFQSLKHFSAFDCSSFYLVLSSLISLSAAFHQAVYGSNCFTWHIASFSFWWNLPYTTFLHCHKCMLVGHHPSWIAVTSSHVLHSGYHWKSSSSSNVSGINCAHLWPLLDTVVANIKSEKTECASWWLQSFIWNHLDNKG